MQKLKCDKTQKLIVTKLKKIKFRQNSNINCDKTKIVKKKTQKNCDKTQILTKIENSSYDNSKTLIVTKLKTSN